MHIVGIIGPYISGGNRRRIDHNIANARYVAVQLANHFKDSQLVGFFVPHNHTAQFERFAEAGEPYYHTLDDTIYDRACDGFVLLPGWEQSSGSRRDRARALERKKLVFELAGYEDEHVALLVEQLTEWAENRGGEAS